MTNVQCSDVFGLYYKKKGSGNMPDPDIDARMRLAFDSERQLLITTATTTAFTTLTISTLLLFCLTLFRQFVEFSHLLFR